MNHRMPIQRGLARIVGLLLWAATVSGIAAAANPAAPPSADEQKLFAATNQARADQGLSPLRWDDSLAQAARAHAQLIMRNSQLSHQYPGEPGLAVRAAQAGAHFQSVAENIAVGPSADAIQKQWMKSMPHRSNILDPQLNSIGFAVLERGGYLYAVADFARSVEGLTVEQAEQSVEKLISAQGVQVTGPRQDARQTCEMSHGTAGGSQPRFVMRWQGSDLSQLPPALRERLGSGQFKTAAVGACASANAEQGFTIYRVAVLLY
jgi:hypothetical protein